MLVMLPPNHKPSKVVPTVNCQSYKTTVIYLFGKNYVVSISSKKEWNN